MMRRHDLLARRDLLKSAAALSAGMALQRAHLAGAQDASPTVEPQEVTVTNPGRGQAQRHLVVTQQPRLRRREPRHDRSLPGSQS